MHWKEYQDKIWKYLDRLPKSKLVVLKDIVKPENREDFIYFTKKYILKEYDDKIEHKIEFNDDYTKIKRS